SKAMQEVNLEADPSKKLSQLSGGMKQKLAIASILLQKTDTLFLDETTSMLDTSSTYQLWDLLMQHWENQTVVIVEHKVDYIWNYVDRVIVMNDKGQITHDSTPDDILNNHTDVLNEYGVWHPNSWNYAHKSLYINHKIDPLLIIIIIEQLRICKQLYYINTLYIIT